WSVDTPEVVCSGEGAGGVEFMAQL
ncbi:MAG: hypothetical protein QOF67_2204, partial [Mycobacterium sp.]|nr:hypothetical protein [Mycobacterium sp.]